MSPAASPTIGSTSLRLAVIGPGRLGRALARALRAAGCEVEGPLGRGELPGSCDAVLLCVPEPAIAGVAATIPAGPMVAHCSASAPLDWLAPHERFNLHPLMTVTADGARFDGAWCAVDGSTRRALELAEQLASLLGMRPIRVAPDERALYHAAAVLASGSLVALEASAGRTGAMVGLPESALVPLARAALDNWEALGASVAVTGPIARNDTATADRLRAALGGRVPDLVPLWDALADATRTTATAPVAPRARGALRVMRTVAELREALAPARRRGLRIGMVPTMGALHEGHLSLMRRARDACDVVVATLFVNPAQFNDARDLAAYPRDEAGDAAMVRGVGVDILFAPDASEVYPDGFATMVEVKGLTDVLEGAARGTGHFRGVTTVVSKLLNMARPDVAYFGQKDAQQALVIKRLARDLDFGVRIEVCPIVRESDGLAMSSRNVRLDRESRTRATALSAALFALADAFAGGERSAGALLGVGRGVLAARGINPADVDYLAIVDVDTLRPLEQVNRPALVAIAAHVGGVRLIDNVLLA